MPISRRDFIKTGAGAAGTLMLGCGATTTTTAASQTAQLIVRPIPSTGETVPVVGIGGRNYRVGPSAEERAPFKATIKAFAERGGTVLDTAPSYGNSESVMGDIMAELGIRGDLFIATKVDKEGKQAGLDVMEASFNYLHTDRVDLMQVHNLRDTDTQLETMRQWKDQGRIRYLGVTTSSQRQHERFAEVMEKHDLDFVQLNYSLGSRQAAERLLPLAADRGTGVLVNLPFGRGRLFQRVGERSLPDWAADIDAESWGQVFLKYVISHPAITVAIPGTTKEHHAVDNMGAARGRLPDAALRQEIERFYDALPELTPQRRQ